MDEKSQKNTKQILETGNSEFDQPDDISEDAKLADNLHKFGGLTRSHHVVGGHWRLKNIDLLLYSLVRACTWILSMRM